MRGLMNSGGEKWKYLHWTFFGVFMGIGATSLQEILDHDILAKYKRATTIVYASPDPEFLLCAENHVIVYWTSAPLLKMFTTYNLPNYVLLQGPLSLGNMIDLSDCEHFDIAIIDMADAPQISLEIHLADHTLLITDKILPELVSLGEVNQKHVYHLHKPKKLFKKNWWQSCSFHQNYSITSNYHEKYFIKPKEYVDTNNEIKFNWMPGINLYTFFNLGGIYPSPTYFRRKVLEIFDPLICNDFGLGNIILQGKQLRIIDFDTNHGDPYQRLRKTLVNQMGMKDYIF